MLPLTLLGLLPLLAAPTLGLASDLNRGLTSEWDLQREELEYLGVLNRKVDTEAQSRVAGTNYGPHCFQQKKSHFDDSLAGQEFCQRYLLDASHYKPGGPVLILDNGESHNLSPRYFEEGLLGLLAQETNGVAVVLEHRYYGNSTLTPDFSTDNMRWLNNKEALEDSAQFIRNFPAPDGVNLTAPDALSPSKTPFLYIGGSYPGGRALFMRKHYPDLVWGALGSSAVVHAQVDMPEWFGSIEEHADEKCVQGLSDLFLAIDKLLDGGDESNKAVKSYFGLDEDMSNWTFATYLQGTFAGEWQTRTWKKPESEGAWGQWCAQIEGAVDGDALHVESLGEVPATFPVMKQRIEDMYLSDLAPGMNASALSVLDHPPAEDVSLENKARVWRFQTCTEWGYWQGAPSDPEQRRVVSKYATVDRWLQGCHSKFPPGKHYSIPAQPDVSKTNSLGDYDIAGDRFATVDGEWDPWRAMTIGAMSRPPRENTANHPYWVIPNGAHCWDWRRLPDLASEPEDVQEIHKWEVEFIKTWVKQFHDEKGSNTTQA